MSAETILVRPARAAAAPALGEVSVRCWRETYRGLMSDRLLDALSAEERVGGWRDRLAGAAAPPFHFTAEQAGEVVGFGACGARRGSLLPGDGEVYSINLLRKAQGRGGGRGLMSAMTAALARAGFRSVSLWVLRENWPARRFYERLGGREVAERLDLAHGEPLAKIAYD